MSEQVIEIRRFAEGTDIYGDPVPGSYAKVAEYVGKFAPNNPSEPVEVGRNAVITGGTVYVRDLDARPDIRDSDRAFVQGDLYEIDGKIGLWKRSKGWAVQFAVKAVSG